jgi:alpha-D-ribose 1-methylphosphonate 5-triphosphate synthase subunit PhnG
MITAAMPQDAAAADALGFAEGGMAMRTVEIDGQTRVVGIASLGGRRRATAEDIAIINARLETFEAPAAVAPVVPGVVSMDVEEVGRPSA